jgi:peroxiredoxin
MSNKTYNLIVTILVLVILIGGGMLLYRHLENRVVLEVPATGNPTAETAPDFTVQDASDGVWSLSDFRGKPVVLNFWSSNCPPCMAEMPLFQEYWEKYGEEVQFMIVNLTDGYNDTFASAMKVVQEENYTFPVFFDTNVEGASAYSIYSIPMTFFIDENGVIVSEHLGMLTEKTLEAGIQGILKK